jgi:hypothetical protein
MSCRAPHLHTVSVRLISSNSSSEIVGMRTVHTLFVRLEQGESPGPARSVRAGRFRFRSSESRVTRMDFMTAPATTGHSV